MSAAGWPPYRASKGTRGRVVPVVNIDVADMIPRELLPREIRHLERVWNLEPGDPVAALLATEVTNDEDRMLRAYLLQFASQVIEHYRKAARSAAAVERKRK